MSALSPVVLLVIVILAIIFFITGLLHLLARILMKRSTFSSISQSNRHPETTTSSHVLQRQLQQLFRLHDSGLDQSLIDVLPVFYYKDIMGLKQPFDCPVCLCEFSGQDKLRLLPICSHAFHIHCIDTWLLSNSTCPLCRGSLVHPGTSLNPLFNLDDSLEQVSGFSSDGEDELFQGLKPETGRENANETRVFSVRLGKFKSLNKGEEKEEERIHEQEEEEGEISRCHLEARRCYSMGSFQYVVGDSELQVALPNFGGMVKYVKHVKVRHENENENESSALKGDVDGKKISGRVKCESFSVSKIWLWSKDKQQNRHPTYPLDAADVDVGVAAFKNDGMACQ